MLARVKRLTSHVGIGRYLHGRETAGFLVRQTDIPSPYAWGPTHVVYHDPKHWRVIVVETRHKTYDVFKVPPAMDIYKTDAEATDAFMATRNPPPGLVRV